MTWWRRFLSAGRVAALPKDPSRVPMPGWQVAGRDASAVYWRDPVGDVISLTLAPPDGSLPPLSHTAALRTYCRRIAQAQEAGLVEATAAAGAEGPSLTYIYKRLRIPAFTFFGVAITPIPSGTWMWMIVAYERGTTGIREAAVTGQLAEAGQLTLESYEASWAQDPYDPSYAGVDRSTLRYRSDAQEYDAQFPYHPLTKVRRELPRLLTIPLSSGTAA